MPTILQPVTRLPTLMKSALGLGRVKTPFQGSR
jgi:hypothetical protein